MKILMILVLFNVNTHAVHDPHLTGESFDTVQQCTQAQMDKGVQKPDEKGDIKLYGCAIPVPKKKDTEI